MRAGDFDEILGRIRGLLVTLASTLSPEESGEVGELLDHAELGEALRTLAWLIVEEGKLVAVSDAREIEVLAGRMGIRDELPVTLLRRGAGDG